MKIDLSCATLAVMEIPRNVIEALARNQHGAAFDGFNEHTRKTALNDAEADLKVVMPELLDSIGERLLSNEPITHLTPGQANSAASFIGVLTDGVFHHGPRYCEIQVREAFEKALAALGSND